MPADYDVGAAIERIENELIDSMMRNLKLHLKEEEDMGFDWMMWQVEQLKYLEEYRKKNAAKYGKQFRNINLRLKHVLEHGRTYGQKEEEMRILQALKEHPELRRIFKQSGYTRIQGGNFFKINESKLNALIEATTHDMEKAEYAVLRRCNDQYRKIIFDAQMYANTGAGTVKKAVDMATHDFLMRGIDCIEYANGARHTLSDYADMAIRTAERRAYLMGAGEMRKKWGIATVIVNRRGTMTNGNYGTACPKCIPWLGKVLIDDVWSGGEAYINGKDRQQSVGAKAVPTGKSPMTGRNYPLMSAAIAAGLYHPRCKDAHTTYFEGISSEPEPVTKEELKRGAEQERQEARQNYAELQAEKFGRLAKYSLDPENQQKYEARAKEWKERANIVEKPEESDRIEANNTAGEQSRYNPGSDSRAIVSEEVDTDAYIARMRMIGESEKITNIMLYQSRKTLWRRNGTPFEDLIYIDPESGKYLAQRLIDKAGEVTPSEEMKEMVEKKLRKIIAIHNHPHNMLPSLADLRNAKRYKYSVIVCHDGTIIKLSVANNANLRKADQLLDIMQNRFNKREDLTAELSMLYSIGVDMEVIR